MLTMSRVTRRLLPLAALLGALAIAGCTSSSSGELLLADATAQADASTVAIYAVDPDAADSSDSAAGSGADESTRVASAATSPLDITTITEGGQIWVNSLGRVWDDRVLLAYGATEGFQVTAGLPGEEQTRLAGADQLIASVLRRGAFIQTTAGCQLSESVEETEQVGTGNCSISSDERWVVSWPFQGSGLEIRDLRHDSTEKVDLTATSAVALSNGALVLAVTTVEGGQQGVLIDATDGSEIARTETFDSLAAVPLAPSAKGFVLRSGTADGTALHYMDADGELTTIEDGFMVVPVLSGAEVTYLSYSEDLADSALRRWAPGDDEPEDLLTGFIGAGSTDGERVVATREDDSGTGLYYEEAGTGHMALGYTLPRAEGDVDPSAGSGTGVKISRAVLLGSTLYLQVDASTTSSLVRLRIDGGHSDAPITNASGLRFSSLDTDGTALIERSGADGASTQILALRAHDDEPDVRATLAATMTNLIHDGTIYLTDATDRERLTVRSVRASGKDKDVVELYPNRLIAGATWPEWGGATQVQIITPSALLDQIRQQVSSGTTGTTGTTGG